jgi:hypothetical protein
MLEQEPEFGCLEELVRNRNRLAHELANAAESERSTQQYYAKELRMNAYTLRIDGLRRAKGQQPGSLDSIFPA